MLLRDRLGIECWERKAKENEDGWSVRRGLFRIARNGRELLVPGRALNSALIVLFLVGAGLVLRGIIGLAQAATTGIDSIAIEASEYSFQTYEDLITGTVPPDLTVTVQTQVNFDYVQSARIEVPLDYDPGSLGLAAFDDPSGRPAFFGVKALPDLAEYPFIRSIDSSDSSKLVFDLKSLAEYPQIVGMKTFPIVLAFNTAYTNKIPIDTVLWRPKARVSVGGGEGMTAEAPDVVTSVIHDLSLGYSRFLPANNQMPYGGGLSVRFNWTNNYYYQSFFDTSYNNHLFFDVPAGSTVSGESDFSFSRIISDGGASYDRYVLAVDDTSSSWATWHYGGNVYRVSNTRDLTAILPTSFTAGRSFLIRWGADYKTINEAPRLKMDTLDYTVVTRPAWDFYRQSTHSTGNYQTAVSGINNGNSTISDVATMGWGEYEHNGTTRNQGSGSITGVRSELFQITSGAPKVNYSRLVLYAIRDATNPANLPAWSRYRVEFVRRNAITGATRVTDVQNFAPTDATAGYQPLVLSLPNLAGTNEYVDVVRVIPMGTNGTSTGTLPSRNAFSLSWFHGAWNNRRWPDGSTVPDTNSPVRLDWRMYYNNATGVADVVEGSEYTAYYSNQPAAKAQLASSEGPAGVLAGGRVNYIINGVNDGSTSVGTWVNPRVVIRMPSFMTMLNPDSLRLFDASGAVVGSAGVTTTLLGTKDGYRYYQVQVTNWTAPRVNGNATPAFSIPVQFEIDSAATPGVYTIDPAVVSSGVPSTFYTSGSMGVNQALPGGATRADYGFGGSDVYSVSGLASSELNVLALPQLSVETAIRSSATGGQYVHDSIVPAMHGETVQMRLRIKNESSTVFTNLRLYDILPTDGDALGSTGAVAFSNVEIAGAAVRYAGPMDTLPGYGGHGEENPNLQEATFADGWSTSNLGAQTRAIWIDLGDRELNPGEEIDIVMDFVIPGSGDQNAFNQFRYSAKTVGGSATLNQNSPVQGFSTQTIGLVYEKNVPEYAVDEPVGIPAASISSYIAGISDSLIVEDAEPTLTHYVFRGWNTAADGSGTDYAPGQMVEFEGPLMLHLYARWSPEEYEVVFVTNGAGDEIGEQHVLYMENAQEPLTPVRDGYTFEGWYLDAEFEERFDFAAPVRGDVKLYAKWVEVILPPNTGLNNVDAARVVVIAAPMLAVLAVAFVRRKMEKKRQDSES